MDLPPVTVDDDERRRLAECAREPIRTPGRIQSHGRLVGVDPRTGLVHLASENIREWLARPLDEVADPALAWAVRTGDALDPVRIELDGEAFDVIVTAGDPLTLVELEPAAGTFEYARTAVVGAIQRLSAATDTSTLRADAAREIREITGFDRVMVYHFHDDGHGEVVAESRADDLEPYLGLHFPSSDIPPQARQLYVSKLSRAIVSTDDPGSPLLALTDDLVGIDLGAGELRSVSPYHLQFMRNMGQASTVSFSLVRDGALVGMITCAHRSERRLPVLLRRALEVLAAQLTLQLGWLAEIGRLRDDVSVRERRAALLAPLFASDDIHAALLDGPRTVLDVIAADGVAVCVGGVLRTAGLVPPEREIDVAFRALAGETFVSEALPTDRPALAEMLPGIAGLISVPLLDAGDGILFFRGEVARVVNWLGEQTVANRSDGALSPRVSFSAWRQSVGGTSLPWGPLAAEAFELGRELEGALARRAEARLAALALRDALTGLHNRRYLEQLMVTRPADDRVALLFLDLDGFKPINDSYGHDVGDAVLVEVASRLVQHARSGDAVVRLGGDEFVVLCPGVDDATAETIARRLVAAVREPLEVAGRTLTVTASCGVVSSEAGAGSSLVDLADAAMYRAKRGGRDRISH